MKSDTPVVVDVRAVDVGYFSTKLSLGRRYDGGKVAIGTHIHLMRLGLMCLKGRPGSAAVAPMASPPVVAAKPRASRS